MLIVSEAAARRISPGRDPLGRIFEIESSAFMRGLLRAQSRRSMQVIGVVPDSSFLYNPEDRSGRILGTLLLPLARDSAVSHMLLVRIKGDPASGRRAIANVLQQLSLDSGEQAVAPVQSSLDSYLYPYRALIAISGFLGGLALLLTVSGVFGVSSYAVAQRQKEFGIRIALGAGNGQVTGLVLGQSLRFAAAGAALGTAAALALARAVSVPRIDLFDAEGYIAGALVVMASAIAAAWIPARRAVRVDPVETLRCD